MSCGFHIVLILYFIGYVAFPVVVDTKIQFKFRFIKDVQLESAPYRPIVAYCVRIS